MISVTKLSRRQFLLQNGALLLSMTVPLSARTATSGEYENLLAAWQLPSGGYQVGVINLPDSTQRAAYRINLAIDLPTRPHGLMHLQGDNYLVIARRPGDWMMRLNIRTGETSRIWQDTDRHLNGHSARHGELLYTTETDVLSASGALAVRDAHTFELLQVWPTLGRDPHEMVVLPNGGLGINEPFLLVANGGIATHPDMGRTQLNDLPMDSSLVAMHPQTGKILNKWTLNDSRLSLRHMAVHASAVVGVAMQAHHHSMALQHSAPVLALLDEKGLRVVDESAGVKGYAGDIAATPEGFVVSCTKNDSVARFDIQGKLLSIESAEAACALASRGGKVWLGHKYSAAKNLPELDNHWLLV